jgi:hypothetical protein
MENVEYRGFEIKPKNDFGSGPGFLIKGKYVNEGWNVVFNGCNIMPGATWFLNIDDAKIGIDCLIEAGYDYQEEIDYLYHNKPKKFKSNKFWELYWKIKEVA